MLQKKKEKTKFKQKYFCLFEKQKNHSRIKEYLIVKFVLKDGSLDPYVLCIWQLQKPTDHSKC